MKRIVTALLTVFLIAGLCGCAAIDPEKAASNLESKIESGIEKIESGADKIESIADGIGSSVKSSLSDSSDSIKKEIDDVISDSQIIGNDDFGYMRIPKDFKKIENNASGDLQYGNDDGSTIFTLNKISSDIPANNAAEGIISNLKQNGATNLDSCSDAIVNNMSGSEINCYFPEEDRYLTIYLIPFMDKTAYIAMEYTKDNQYMLAYTQSWQNYEFND